MAKGKKTAAAITPPAVSDEDIMSAGVFITKLIDKRLKESPAAGSSLCGEAHNYLRELYYCTGQIPPAKFAKGNTYRVPLAHPAGLRKLFESFVDRWSKGGADSVQAATNTLFDAETVGDRLLKKLADVGFDQRELTGVRLRTSTLAAFRLPIKTNVGDKDLYRVTVTLIKTGQVLHDGPPDTVFE